jgi:hypothetical protein
MSKMRIIGSLNFSRKSFHSGSLSGGVRMFLPYFALLSSAWAEVKPV